MLPNIHAKLKQNNLIGGKFVYKYLIFVVAGGRGVDLLKVGS